MKPVTRIKDHICVLIQNVIQEELYGPDREIASDVTPGTCRTLQGGKEQKSRPFHLSLGAPFSVHSVSVGGLFSFLFFRLVTGTIPMLSPYDARRHIDLGAILPPNCML